MYILFLETRLSLNSQQGLWYLSECEAEVFVSSCRPYQLLSPVHTGQIAYTLMLCYDHQIFMIPVLKIWM